MVPPNGSLANGHAQKKKEKKKPARYRLNPFWESQTPRLDFQRSLATFRRGAS
jgi:hypothetical protein